MAHHQVRKLQISTYMMIDVRDADRFYRSFNVADKARKEINSKYFKKFYKGKPTKRYKKLLNQIRYNAQYTHEDFMRMIRK